MRHQRTSHESDAQVSYFRIVDPVTIGAIGAGSTVTGHTRVRLPRTQMSPPTTIAIGHDVEVIPRYGYRGGVLENTNQTKRLL